MTSTLSRSKEQDKERKIDPGNWELTLSGQMSKTSKIHLIDDSGATTNPRSEEGGRVFNVVSGSILDGVNTTAEISLVVV